MFAPLIVHHQAFQEVIERQVVNGRALLGDVRCVYVHQIELSRHINGIVIQGTIRLAIVKDSPIRFHGENVKPLIEGPIPGGLIPERALHFCEAQIEVFRWNRL